MNDLKVCTWPIARPIPAHQTYAFRHDGLLDALFSAQPWAALNGLCVGDTEELNRGIQVLRDVESRKRPLATVPEAKLLRWCDQEPWARYPALACVISIIASCSTRSAPS